jgi:N-methylhydantoinase A
MVAVESIGAGGGSIVRLTETGMCIGPDSAGASPGPACYNRGGSDPTLTDALAILGYFGEGRADRPIVVDQEVARRSFAPIANALGISSEQAAAGAVRVAGAVAARAIKRITMSRGIDARHCALIAFGGAGPMMACLLADEMAIRKVLVPSRSSALSALGCLFAQKTFTRQRTVNLKESDFDSSVVEAMLSELEAVVLPALTDGPNGDEHDRVEHVALMRYAGQSYEIEIPISRPVRKAPLTEAFRAKHLSTYGFCADEPWECVALRATATRDTKGQIALIGRKNAAEGLLGEARAYFHDYGWCQSREYARSTIKDEVLSGPAIIVDEFSTTVVPPEWTARVVDNAHIQIERSS